MKRLFWSIRGHGLPSWTGIVGDTEADIFQQIVVEQDDYKGFVAVSQTGDSGWWRIAGHNSAPIYGYGLPCEAKKCADVLDTGSNTTDVHHIRALSWHEAFDKRTFLEAEGVALDEVLHDLREHLAECAAAG